MTKKNENIQMYNLSICTRHNARTRMYSNAFGNMISHWKHKMDLYFSHFLFLFWDSPIQIQWTKFDKTTHFYTKYMTQHKYTMAIRSIMSLYILCLVNGNTPFTICIYFEKHFNEFIRIFICVFFAWRQIIGKYCE